MNIKLSKYALLLIPVIFIHCATANKSLFKNTAVFNGNSGKRIESKDKIDKWETFEIFFKSAGDEKCIAINVSCEIFDEILNKNSAVKTYFIIEKAIDISKFSKNNNDIYSELGRNFDYNWNIKQQVDICSSQTDPINTIGKNNIFRIRFTTFRHTNFKYTVNIQSENPVKISETI